VIARLRQTNLATKITFGNPSGSNPFATSNSGTAKHRDRCTSSRDWPPPLDRNDGSSPRSASAAPNALLEVEHLGLRAQPASEQKSRRKQRNVMADGAIDLHEVALPEILDPRSPRPIRARQFGRRCAAPKAKFKGWSWCARR
jgi:hypothetical protein